MFEKTIPEGTRKALAALEKNSITKDAYLAGGTGLALQLGHRIPTALDFFTQSDFNEEGILSKLEKISGFSCSQITPGTVLGIFGNLKFSLFHYGHPLVEKPLKYQKTRVAGKLDIGAMKILACASRGTKRDFVDLYFVCKKVAPLKKLLKVYDRKFGNLDGLSMHIKKSLVYFDDAEADEMPLVLVETCWDDVEEFFTREVRELDV